MAQKAAAEGRRLLQEDEVKVMCESYDIPMVKSRVAVSLEEAVKFADEIGYPVVFKIVSPDITHKSDIGGVILNVKDSGEAADAFDRIKRNVTVKKPEAKIVGVLVQQMAPLGVEVIIGLTRDFSFGPSIMFGLGGVFTEILKDVTFRVCPITEQDAREMITEIKGYPILKGYRGAPPADLNSLTQILLNISRMSVEHPEILEADFNPLIVYEKGAKLVDARIMVSI